jgi:hypothetical protein
MPQEIVAPSNAGPAAVEQLARRMPFVQTSSPFVPISSSSVGCLICSNAWAVRQATVSAQQTADYGPDQRDGLRDEPAD